MTVEANAPTGAGTEAAAPEAGAAVETTTNAAAPAADTQAAAPAADAKAADATLLSAAGTVDDTPIATPADWPADWRAKFAGEDKKLLERLGRFNSPMDILKSWRAAEQRISSGDLKKALPENPTPEQLTEWRKENGIPEKPDDYKIELPNGVVLSEADKPLVKAFTEAVHGKNWTGQQVNDALAWYYGEQDRQIAARSEQDHNFHIESQVALRAELGNDYTPTLNAIKNMFEGAPAGLGDNLLMGRMQDGTRIGDNPLVVKFLGNLARELNPAATLMPAGSGDIRGLDSRIAELKTLIGDRQSEYYKGPNAAKLQAEYRELVDAKQKMKSRAA